VIAALSPYYLTTREPPAMAALLLARRVVTLLPAPGSGEMRDAMALAERSPAYAKFARSWAWTGPLWRAGLLLSGLEGDSPLTDLDHIGGAIRDDVRYAPLRSFLRDEDFAGEQAYLAAVALDLLKAGPDPGLSLPVFAAIDRFGLRHGAVVARSVPTSIAQRAETRLARPLATISVPMLVQADADRILHAREALAPELEALWNAFNELPTTVRDGGTATSDEARALTAAASEFSRAFEASREELLMGAADDDVRVVPGTATLTLLALPSDAVLRAGVAAMQGAGTHAAPRAAASNLPAIADPAEGRWVTAMVVKVLGARSR